MWHWVQRVFGSVGRVPAEPARLSAESEERLSSSLRGLPHGERGWINISEAAQLFSTKDPKYAFGEMDEEGKERLSDFAATCRCEPQFIPAEGRLYFRRSPLGGNRQ
jgi:hypothetical protein